VITYCRWPVHFHDFHGILLEFVHLLLVTDPTSHEFIHVFGVSIEESGTRGGGGVERDGDGGRWGDLGGTFARACFLHCFELEL
jgi:hypothetical protein